MIADEDDALQRQFAVLGILESQRDEDWWIITCGALRITYRDREWRLPASACYVSHLTRVTSCRRWSAEKTPKYSLSQ